MVGLVKRTERSQKQNRDLKIQVLVPVEFKGLEW